ncbi:MAG: MerR family transcriptional regulator [Patescibacteria group bacterium]
MPKLISISQAAKILGVAVMTLRRYDAEGVLKSVRSSPRGHRYYRHEDLEDFLLRKQDLAALARQWIIEPADQAGGLSAQLYCQTQDIFSARLEKLRQELANVYQDSTIISMVPAIAGEIGNNSFDHNLGSWPDIPGVFFGHDASKKRVVLADRGQGVLRTIRRVRPQVATDAEALRVAFTEMISGRAPEARGNGLKFVRNSVMKYPLSLIFQTGDAELILNQGMTDLDIHLAPVTFRGCLVIIDYRV